MEEHKTDHQSNRRSEWQFGPAGYNTFSSEDSVMSNFRKSDQDKEARREEAIRNEESRRIHEESERDASILRGFSYHPEAMRALLGIPADPPSLDHLGLTEQIRWKRDSIIRQIRENSNLFDHWRVKLAQIDLTANDAVERLQQLLANVVNYQKKFPYHFSLATNYSSAHQLMEQLGVLAKDIDELKTLCRRVVNTQRSSLDFS